MEWKDHTHLVGCIVTNLQALETVLRYFLLRVHKQEPQFPKVGDTDASVYEMAIRPIYFFKHQPFIAAVFDVRTTRIVERTVADQLSGGFSPVGHYVAKRVSRYQDPRIALHHELVGKVEAVNGYSLALVDTKDEIQSVDAHEVWLEKKAFPACLAHAFRGNDQAIASALEKARADLRSGPTKLQRITSVVEFFASKKHFLAPNISFKFSPLLSDVSEGRFPALEVTPRPTYIFDQSGSKTDTWNDRGLDQHGPYTAKVFTPIRPPINIPNGGVELGSYEASLAGISQHGAEGARNNRLRAASDTH